MHDLYYLALTMSCTSGNTCELLAITNTLQESLSVFYENCMHIWQALRKLKIVALSIKKKLLKITPRPDMPKIYEIPKNTWRFYILPKKTPSCIVKIWKLFHLSRPWKSWKAYIAMPKVPALGPVSWSSIYRFSCSSMSYQLCPLCRVRYLALHAHAAQYMG